MTTDWLPRSVVLLCVCLLGASARAEEHAITFRVIPQSLPEPTQVFITGNHPRLGNWSPNAVPLERQEDGAWMLTLVFPADEQLEFKITRGEWTKEALAEDGTVSPNATLEVKGDRTVTIDVPAWKDEVFEPQGQITGTVIYHRDMAGPGIVPRDVLVWLPPSYESTPERSYPVLYMHDGQQVFDPATSTHGIDWQVDERVTELVEEGQMREIIVVAIGNTPNRNEEYAEGDKGKAYRDFVIHTLKPFIDAAYRTLPGREHTGTMGASMGGLVSFLLVRHHADVISMAGCLSPSFPTNVINAVHDQEISEEIKIYMDNGGVGLEQQLQPGCDRMLEALQAKGFTRGDNLVWFQDLEAAHKEEAWARRVWRPLVFMFGEK